MIRILILNLIEILSYFHFVVLVTNSSSTSTNTPINNFIN